MNPIKKELIEYIEFGYDFDAVMDLGGGWSPYEGCRQNLVMILEEEETTVEQISEMSEFFIEGIRRYHITIPDWWKKGVIALSFDEGDF